ncbi:MAG: hypothetical protein ABH846_03505 [Patescibacteria group bacterium]
MFPRKKKQDEFKPWHGYLMLAVIFVAVVMGIVQRINQSNEPVINQELPVIVTQETCQISGGTWNNCGSNCRTTPDEACIQVCVEQCECISDSQCPFSYHCGDYIDGTGICLSL